MDNKFNEIIFTDTFGVSEEYYPKPAGKLIPDWYKTLESYMGGKKEPDEDDKPNGTIKRCMPVFDAISSGYIIELPVDIWVKQKEQPPKVGDLNSILDVNNLETQPRYQWTNFNIIEFHSIEQAPNHPNRGGHRDLYPKFMNPWAIKTPPGYSTIFVQPFHRDAPFTILPGVVDTDTYTAPINFPFVLNDAEKFSGLIPAGTPIAQVIPFKREIWQMKIGGQDELVEQAKVRSKVRTKFFDNYKTQFRQQKEYK